jgi:hypothetical protein
MLPSSLVPSLMRRAAATACWSAVAAHRHTRSPLLRRLHTRPSAADAHAAARALGIGPWTGYGVGVENVRVACCGVVCKRPDQALIADTPGCCYKQAVTLPASWYTSPAILQLEKRAVLHNSWQVGGCGS